MTAKQESELLIKQLEIVIEHCEETGLKAGAGVIREAIIIIRTANMGIELFDNIKKEGV